MAEFDYGAYLVSCGWFYQSWVFMMLLNNYLPVNSGHAVLICACVCISWSEFVNYEWDIMSGVFLEFTVIFDVISRFLMLLWLMLSQQGWLVGIDDGQIGCEVHNNIKMPHSNCPRNI